MLFTTPVYITHHTTMVSNLGAISLVSTSNKKLVCENLFFSNASLFVTVLQNLFFEAQSLLKSAIKLFNRGNAFENNLEKF